MKLPKSVRILNNVYAIEFDAELGGRGLAGEVDYAKKAICLNPELSTLPPYELLQTLWHEIIHAYSQEAGLNQILQAQSREMVCESLSRLIIDLTGGKIRCKS
jgi:hypothetical protein